jgi:hypothetical protein
MLSSICLEQHEFREPRGEQGESQQALADPCQQGIVASLINTWIAATMVFFLAYISMYVSMH